MRAVESQDFLARIGWGAALRAHLAGDASARSYDRVRLGDQRAVLMDAPSGCGDDVGDFIRIATHLQTLGLSAPQILAADEDQGFLLLEDLGDDLFAQLTQKDPLKEQALYLTAAQALAVLQSAPAPKGLLDLSARDWASSVGLCAQFYARAILGHAPDDKAMIDALCAALLAHADGPRVLILRDFHAENLLWLPDRQGVAKVGLLDFQLGQMGQREYDLVSLLQDARRDVLSATEAAVIAAFPGVDPAAYATLGALRALRILGIFARLCMVQGKDRYLAFVPRVWGQLLRNLDHPALADLRAKILAILPAPSPENIERIRQKCAAEPIL